MLSTAERAFFATQGIHLPHGTSYAEQARRVGFAMDAQFASVFPANAGIPWQLANIIDTEVIRALVTPMKAAEILGGETSKGSWTTLTAQFPVAESVGFTSSYGDFNNNGNAGANFGWVPRQSYMFQTISQWGEREQAMFGEAAISYTTELNTATALVHSKFMNKTYFYGVSGLQNYGLINDPSLTATISPGAKAVNTPLWLQAKPEEVNFDFQLLYARLQTQLGGNLQLDTPMVLAMSPASEVTLLNTNLYGVSIRDMLKKNFPNLKVITAPEYATVGGNLVQLICPEFEGVRTAYPAFTEKMRAHNLVPDLSSWKQKKSGGTWGCVIRRPLAIAQMLGV